MKSVYPVLFLALFSVLIPTALYAEEINPAAQSNIVVPTADMPSGNGSSTCTAEVSPANTRGMWVWNTSIVTDLAKKDSGKADELFAFSKASGVTTLYMNSYDILVSSSKTGWGALSDFLNRAKANCLSVELLGGEANWYQRQHILKATNFATQAVAFTESLDAADAKPTAVHLNVEPYSANSGKDWNANSGANRGTISTQFLTMLATTKLTLADSGLALSVDMPYWFDSTPGVTSITRLGKTKTLAAHVTDIADAVTVLTFRDNVSGISDLSKTVIAYAGKTGKPATIGVTTKCYADAAFSVLTFCGTRTEGDRSVVKGAAYMETELAKVKDEFAKSKGFGGVAIHYYETYKVLGE